jgi:hypothetical protein
MSKHESIKVCGDSEWMNIGLCNDSLSTEGVI